VLSGMQYECPRSESEPGFMELSHYNDFLIISVFYPWPTSNDAKGWTEMSVS
jgi:hypothetical protein